ncbi:neutral zinc metallopeptidase [uncultured Aquimonas sp.]|jgi:predicted metalloprotease|uniref:KPN_02809 family neutral zinc metallopeptidase n=1 Tax=uncultured Aquimonas sp. TaxID=385483 RepID=UPI00086BCA7F|nr:neutral zinc metallopeptidase [uncultured Aquimonas sp.]ODU43524.1 MAG: metallopeptidase [Xanthomonadaceae bacterium SCN 69-123]
MRWERLRRSSNVTDSRGRGGGGGRLPGGGKGLGLTGILIVVVIAMVMGKNPLELLSLLDAGQQQTAPSASSRTPLPDPQDPAVEFVRAVLGDTEDAWGEIFAASGSRYEPAGLEVFEGGVTTACGFASSAVGPFYCPGDRKVYIDLQFFRELETRFRAAGDFAQAYVIAHEVGHHIQTLTGVSARVNAARQRGEEVKGDGGLLVRQELQADCYAGVWAHSAQRRFDILEPGDLEEALNAASAIGDDRLQKQAQGRVVPDSFSHGTSEQRMRWFRLGFERGSVGACDTFAASRL